MDNKPKTTSLNTYLPAFGGRMVGMLLGKKKPGLSAMRRADGADWTRRVVARVLHSFQRGDKVGARKAMWFTFDFNFHPLIVSDIIRLS